jgi:aldehyde dehydrogenase (NAD+)
MQSVMCDLGDKISLAKTTPATSYEERVVLLEYYAGLIKAKREHLAKILSDESKKTMKDSLSEVDGAADIIGKTIKDATLPEFNGMIRRKERVPVGIVGLITSFNFPIAVAHWTIAPALLAGNKVIWKPSEKTPSVAVECKKLFDEIAGNHKGLFQVVVGERDIGEALVSHEDVDMVSATGSVAMGEGIQRALAKKKNNSVPPILELGGNNAVVIGEQMSDAHLEWSLKALMQSFLASTGQRCTNTRRLIVHKKWLDKTVQILKQMVGDFIARDMNNIDNAFSYSRLVDQDAYNRLEKAKQVVKSEGGTIYFGGENEPVLAVLPKHSDIMYQETFAPILFITSYDGGIEEAMKLVNAPKNAGLVNGIYTLSKKEADGFAALNEAGHGVINSPKGTGTPAFGMGFGGNKDSGTGEILNATDPLQAFTRPGTFKRIATNKDVLLS